MIEDSDYEFEGSPPETNQIGTYEGSRNDEGERDGNGKAVFPNGDVYNGDYSKGKRNGLGVYKFKNARYDGEYSNGKRQGEGTMYYPDGSIYKGHWEDGDKSGKGTYSYPNGDTYEGEWKDDQKHGRGVYTYKESGTIFKGSWLGGLREGQADWINKSYSYSGYFRDDYPIGRGRFYFTDGCEQHGYYKIKDVVEQVENATEVVGRATRWSCTALIRSPPATIISQQ